MKQVLTALIFLLFTSTVAEAQQSGLPDNKFRTFSRAELSYLFGLNDAVLNQKTNSLHVKLVIGKANSRTGLGIGLENASYRSADGYGASFETLNFSANAHLLAKPIQTEELNYFIKGAAGYAPKLFSGYNKGFNYEVASGVVFTTKRKTRYFLQAIYHYQVIDGFNFAAGTPKIKGIGLGAGTWL